MKMTMKNIMQRRWKYYEKGNVDENDSEKDNNTNYNKVLGDNWFSDAPAVTLLSAAEQLWSFSLENVKLALLALCHKIKIYFFMN